ncbi:MAG TPA: Uma2 family endonuclease [Tepidisphaeraceae bacterium]|nr:Uma2 family endonuclease [Tepidisphaeraceae bacterium]
MLDLAQRLQGRPIPDLRLTESQFEKEFADIKAEWVDGQVIIMAPVCREHADLNGWLFRLLSEFVEHHDLGSVLGLEFPMRVVPIRTWRCPDIMFVGTAKLSRLHPTYLAGGPDLVMEIVSPDGEARDWRDKYNEYESTGVREYWVVDPLSKRVDAYALSRSKHYSQIQPDDEGRIYSKTLRGLHIRPDWLWHSPLPKLSGVLKELKLR